MAKKRVGILISGRGSNMVALIEAARSPDFPAEIALVLSNRPDAAGIARAQDFGIPARAMDHKAHAGREAFERAMHAELEAAGVEIVALAGFLRLLTPWFIETWRDRMINIHPALLPAYKGLHTHERAIADGVRIAGCTVHYVRHEMDVGPIVAQAAVPVLPGDDADRLAARVLTAEHRLFPLALKLVAEGRAPVRRRDDGSEFVDVPAEAFGVAPTALVWPPDVA